MAERHKTYSPGICKHPKSEVESSVIAPDDPNLGYCYACFSPVKKHNGSWELITWDEARSHAQG